MLSRKMTSRNSREKKLDPQKLITKVEEIINNFNPVTHSIDSYCQDVLGDLTTKEGKPDAVFIHQVVYGYFREKAVIDGFITNLYGDNTSNISRADVMLYRIFAYLGIFRLEEIGVNRFKEFVVSQAPDKMFNFVNYLFNKEILWSSLRSAWMKVRDLSYVEDELIASIEIMLPQVSPLLLMLQEKALGIAAAAAAKEEAQKSGTVGLGAVTKKGATRPVSPNLTKPRLPVIPEPEKIDQDITAHPVPGFINRISLADIEEERKRSLEETRKKTASKYTPDTLFKLNETKSGKSIDEVRKEIEVERSKELKFDMKYVVEPPDFSKIPAKVRITASSVLREDFLFRKQQEKDVAILKRYEEELRDPTEFYAWQGEMKEEDHKIKLKQVALRREQARDSAVEAKYATEKQKVDNKTVANMIREQAKLIVEKVKIEDEIQEIKNKEIVAAITEIRETKPAEAVQKVTKERIETGKQLRIELEKSRIKKEEEMAIEEEIRNDKIRQLRAMNTVTKEYIKVFDPTESSGKGFLDEMSYMEMKERLQTNKAAEETEEINKRQEIIENRQKSAKALEERAISIQRARKLRADAAKTYYEEKRASTKRLEDEAERMRETAAIHLEAELKLARDKRKKELDDLKEEQDRVRRQQQYLGANAGAVEEARHAQQQMAQERDIDIRQREGKYLSQKADETNLKDRKNKELLATRNEISKMLLLESKDAEFNRERKNAIEKLKNDYVSKKTMVKIGHEQHDRTEDVKIKFNPYASRITDDVYQQSIKWKNSSTGRPSHDTRAHSASSSNMHN